MAQPGKTTLGCRSSVSFGIHSESKKMMEMQKIRSKNRRFSVLVASIIVTLVIFLVSLVIYDVINTSKNSRNIEIKRIIDLEEPEHLDTIKPSKLIAYPNDTENVMIVPQSIAENEKPNTHRRLDEHPNHRYEDIESKERIIERMMKDIYAENGWSPRPFEIHPATKSKLNSLNNIQDIIHQVELNDDKRAKSKIEEPPYAGMGRPIRFKGVYVRPKLEEDEEESKSEESQAVQVEDEKQKYLQQINQLLENNAESFEPNFGKSYGNHQQRFQQAGSELYTKAIHHPFDLEQPPKELRKTWTKRNQEVYKKPKKQPITVMLDIYPMTKTEDEQEEVAVKKPRKEIIYIPIKPGEQFFEPISSPSKAIAMNLIPPNQRRKLIGPKGNRMIMKLNLFPKRREMRKRGGMYNPRTDTRIGEVIYPRQHAQRRTFGFFSKLKKKFLHDDCNVIGHNPKGKPIVAKWKDKNGDWVHAKYVALKQWDDD